MWFTAVRRDRDDLALVAGAAILVCLVSGPVLAEALRRHLSKQAAKAAPRIFFSVSMLRVE